MLKSGSNNFQAYVKIQLNSMWCQVTKGSKSEKGYNKEVYPNLSLAII